MPKTDPWTQVGGDAHFLSNRCIAGHTEWSLYSSPPQVHDIDGQDHYRSLGLRCRASSAEIKKVNPLSGDYGSPGEHRNCTSPFQYALQAYRDLARLHHPDKGGNAANFARILAAFEVLSDERKRAVYDVWAKELEYRYIEGVASKVRALGRRDMVWLCLA